MRTGDSIILKECIEYAIVQPMPLVFLVTIIILLIGVIRLINGLKHK